MATQKKSDPKDMIISPDEVPAAYQAIQKKITTEVWKDESLRAKMLKNPQATIEGLIGHKFDEGLNVRVVDSVEDTVTFFLPPKKEKALGKGEFSDVQLDAVAGGFGFDIISGIFSAATGLGAAIAGGVAAGTGDKKAAQAAGILGAMSQF